MIAQSSAWWLQSHNQLSHCCNQDVRSRMMGWYSPVHHWHLYSHALLLQLWIVGNEVSDKNHENLLEARNICLTVSSSENSITAYYSSSTKWCWRSILYQCYLPWIFILNYAAYPRFIELDLCWIYLVCSLSSNNPVSICSRYTTITSCRWTCSSCCCYGCSGGCSSSHCCSSSIGCGSCWCIIREEYVENNIKDTTTLTTLSNTTLSMFNWA